MVSVVITVKRAACQNCKIPVELMAPQKTSCAEVAVHALLTSSNKMASRLMGLRCAASAGRLNGVRNMVRIRRFALLRPGCSAALRLA